MAAAAILNYYFVTPDHSRSQFAVLNLPFKFCTDRVYTFRDIAIWKFRKFGLKCLFKPPLPPKKIMFWGEFWPLNFTFYHRDPQKAFPCAETRVLSPYWSWSVLRCDLDATRRIQKKKEPKVSQNSPFSQTPFPSSYINQVLHAGSYPGYLSWFWVSKRSVEKCRSGGGRIFGFPIDLAHRLYNSLLLSHKPWCCLLENRGCHLSTQPRDERKPT